MTRIPQGIELTPFDAEFARDPYAVYARLREAAPVHYDGTSYTVSGYREVAELLRDHRLSVDPRRVGQRRDPRADNPVTLRPPDMMNLDDPDHARLRREVSRAFTQVSVADFEPRIRRIAAQLLQDLPRQFDAIACYAGPLSTRVIAEYIGIDADLHVAFKAWTDTLLMQGYPMPTEAQWQAIVAADASMRACIGEIVDARAHAPGDDLVSRLIQTELDRDEVVDLCNLLVGAGSFTTTDLIGNALLRHSESDGDSVAGIVNDTLRLDPPSQSVRRWALEDIEVGGVTINTGSAVQLFIGAANHDPQAGPHLAFGRGVHHCLGAMLARLVAQVALNILPPFDILACKRRKSLLFRGCSELLIALR